MWNLWKNNILRPFVLGIGIPALVTAFLKVTNVDDMYIGSGVDLNNYIMRNGQMLSFSEFVSSALIQASCVLTPLTLIKRGIKREVLYKKEQEIKDYITYYQLVLGSLRKHADNIGLKHDYELSYGHGKKRMLTLNKNNEK